MTILLADNFNRSLTGSWGTSSHGEAWTERQGASNQLSVNGAQGKIDNTTAGRVIMSIGSGLTDVEVTATATPSTSDSEIGVNARFQPSVLSYYSFRVNGTAGGALIYRIDNGSGTLIAGISAFTLTPGTAYDLKFRVIGSSLRAKVWQHGQAEPGTWLFDITDSTYASGGCGVVAVPQNSTGVLFDDFLVTDGVTSVTTQKTVSSRLNLFAVAQKAVASRFKFFTGAQKTFSTRLFFGQIAVQKFSARFRIFAVAQRTFASRFKQDGYLSQKSIAARLFHYAIAQKVYRGRLRLFDVAQRTYRSRLFLFSLARKTFATRFSLYVPDLNAQMTWDDARQQYAIIKASSTAARIAVIAIVLYPPATVVNEHVVPAEVDVLLKGEDWSQLHELRTIGQVNDFLARFP